MNFYKHHLGDYDSATAHLSWDEDQAYTRLLRVYYRLEKPIALDPGAAYRLVRAATRTQKEAVTRVLHEFFEEQSDGWHNRRADEEIVAYQSQATTNRRIARARIVDRSVDEPLHESSTNRTPNHKPEPRTRSQEPKEKQQQSQKHSAAARRPGTELAFTADLWAAYATAYQHRYGVEPIRNAKVNGQLASFMTRVPRDEAPDIAAFYVVHNKGLYVSARHCVDLLLRDAEGLRTEWFTGRRVTETAARQADQSAARGDVFHELIEEARREKTA